MGKEERTRKHTQNCSVIVSGYLNGQGEIVRSLLVGSTARTSEVVNLLFRVKGHVIERGAWFEGDRCLISCMRILACHAVHAISPLEVIAHDGAEGIGVMRTVHIVV